MIIMLVHMLGLYRETLLNQRQPGGLRVIILMLQLNFNPYFHHKAVHRCISIQKTGYRWSWYKKFIFLLPDLHVKTAISDTNRFLKSVAKGLVEKVT